MFKAKLLTTDGRYVCTAILPPFVTPPEVLVWGIRAFKYVPRTPGQKDVYYECFAYTVVQHQFEEVSSESK